MDTATSVHATKTRLRSWLHASSALTASEREKPRGRSAAIDLGHRAFREGDFLRARMASRHSRPTGTVMIDICLDGRTRQYPRLGPEMSNLVMLDDSSPPRSDGATMRVS